MPTWLRATRAALRARRSKPHISIMVLNSATYSSVCTDAISKSGLGRQMVAGASAGSTWQRSLKAPIHKGWKVCTDSVRASVHSHTHTHKNKHTQTHTHTHTHTNTHVLPTHVLPPEHGRTSRLGQGPKLQLTAFFFLDGSAISIPRLSCGSSTNTHKERGMKKKRKTTQAAKYSLHQLRKRRHIGPKCRESFPPKGDEKTLLEHYLHSSNICAPA